MSAPLHLDTIWTYGTSVQVLSSPYMDYLHIAKIGDRWCIANVRWEVREGATEP